MWKITVENCNHHFKHCNDNNNLWCDGAQQWHTCMYDCGTYARWLLFKRSIFSWIFGLCLFNLRWSFLMWPNYLIKNTTSSCSGNGASQSFSLASQTIVNFIKMRLLNGHSILFYDIFWKVFVLLQSTVHYGSNETPWHPATVNRCQTESISSFMNL